MSHFVRHFLTFFAALILVSAPAAAQIQVRPLPGISEFPYELSELQTVGKLIRKPSDLPHELGLVVGRTVCITFSKDDRRPQGFFEACSTVLQTDLYRVGIHGGNPYLRVDMEYPYAIDGSRIVAIRHRPIWVSEAGSNIHQDIQRWEAKIQFKNDKGFLADRYVTLDTLVLY